MSLMAKQPCLHCCTRTLICQDDVWLISLRNAAKKNENYWFVASIVMIGDIEHKVQNNDLPFIDELTRA